MRTILLIGAVLAASFLVIRLARAQAGDGSANDTPRSLASYHRCFDFPVAPDGEHIYGIAFEIKGPEDLVLKLQRYATFRADGRSRDTNGFDTDKYPFYRLGLTPDWQVCRIEVHTLRDATRLVLSWDLFRDGKTVTTNDAYEQAQVRNLRLVEGGFPEDPPLLGAPYVKWIQSLRANRAYAQENPYYKPAELPRGFDGKDFETAKRDVAPYLEVSPQRLMELMPTRRYFGRAFGSEGVMEFADYRWDPRRPDELRTPAGALFDVAAKYPTTGEQDVRTPSGNVVKYPYYDPPGTTPPVIVGDLPLPAKWRVFGPVPADAPVPKPEILTHVPDALTIQSQTLKSHGIDNALRDGMLDLDFNRIFGRFEKGMNGYAFAEIEAESVTDLTFGTGVTLGAGSDWWMQWWVNGQPVFDTLNRGNDGKWPPAITDWSFTVHLAKGKNVLAIRVISGAGSFRLVAGGPRELRREAADGGNTPPTRVYLDRFMASTRIAEMTRAAYRMAGIYRKTGDKQYALRSAAILSALMQAVPDWPIFGVPGSGGDPRFYAPDDYSHWMAFIVGDWYTPSMEFFQIPAKTYDLIREAPVWDEVARLRNAEARAVVENGLLSAARTSLRYDAYRRARPWELYHNTIGTQLSACIMIGRVVGCPELIHYAVAKTRGAVQSTYMADGMFPESTSYANQMADGFLDGFTYYGRATGYSDPPGFVAAFDGKRFDNLDLRREIPMLGLAAKYKNEYLTFPNGAHLTVHDTCAWNRCQARTATEPFLVPDFGHARLGWGKKDHCVEAHLHFSGAYTHRHFDMLTFTLWAYGDELVSDVGYTHLGGYPYSTAAHNLVLVDSALQRTTQRGSLLAWCPGIAGTAQAALACDTQAYQQTRLYRRALIGVPFAPGRDAVVDIFEVEGGDRHEWLANGCADYGQNMQTNLTLDTASGPETWTESAADGGKLMTVKDWGQGRYVRGLICPDEEPGQNTIMLRAFRRIGHDVPLRMTVPWQVTMTAKPPVPEGTPGAYPRAMSTDPKPGLRLHWLGPADAQPILAWAPRNRYWQEFDHLEEARAVWFKDLMPKVIVRRDGKDLASAFLAIWEPFPQSPWLVDTRTVAGIPAADGFGVVLKGTAVSGMVLYRRPESTATLRAPGLASDGLFAILREQSGWTSLDVYEGTRTTAGPVTVETTPYPDMPVLRQERFDSLPCLILKGRLPGYPTAAARQPHAGGYVRFTQTGHENWWLPVTHMEAMPDGNTRLVLAREIGFVYDDSGNGHLRETSFPFRLMAGKATVGFPTRVNVRWHALAEVGGSVKVAGTGAVRLSFAGLTATRARLHAQGDRWIDIETQRTNGRMSFELPAEARGNGMAEISLSK